MSHNNKSSCRSRSAILRRKPLAAAIASFFAVTPVWSADIAPANGNTTMFNHPTGVPVVNIAKPNGGGLSHNQYTVFNVPTQGAVLNNATQVTMSQLAGSVPVNVNLGGRAANTILNEVVSVNRSQLNGFLEVAGQQANVIVANPYGITCNGCGFINTPRVTLTTGAPTFAGDGSLSGFLVNGGNVLVNGGGLNATAQDILDLVARSVTLDGKVNGKDVQITAGANEFDYTARSVSGSTAGSGATPAYAIDSTALGGLYANRIRLVATDNNVGVRMLGEAAATTDDLVLTAAGKIELRNKASSARDVSVTYNGSTPADVDAITIGGSGNSLSAGRDLVVSGGGLTLDGGKLTANGNLDLDVNSLTETGAAGQRAAAGTVTVDSSGAANLNGGSWDAGNNLSITADSLSVGSSGASFFASRNATGSLAITTVTGALDLGTSTLKNSDAINLASASALSLAAGGSVQGGKNINLTAIGNLQNGGTLKAQQDIVLRAGSAALLEISLGGEVRSGGSIDIAGFGATPGSNIDLDVSGTAVAGDQLKVKAADVSVSGLLQGSNGTSLSADTLTVSGSSARLVTSTSTAASTLAVDTLNIGALAPAASGTLQSRGKLNLDIGNALNNYAGSKLLGADDIVIRSSNAGSAISVYNAGDMQAGSPATGTTPIAGKTLDIAGYDSGAGANSAVNFSNIGNVYADILTLKLNTLANGVATGSNTAVMAASSSALINVAGTLSNYAGSRLLLSSKSTGTGTLNLDALLNRGSLESAGSLALTAVSSIDNNGGKLLSNGDMTVRAGSGSTLGVTNQNGGIVQAGGLLDIAGFGATPGSNVNITNSATITGKRIQVKGGTVSNSGTIQAGTVSNNSYSKTSGDAINLDVLYVYNLLPMSAIIGDDVTLNVATALDNKGAIHAGSDLVVNSRSVSNSSTAGMSGLATVRIDARTGYAGNEGNINNAGLIYSNGTLDILALNNISNTADNINGFYAVGNLNITAKKLTNQSKIESKGDIVVSAATIENNIANPGKHWVTVGDQRTYEGYSGRYDTGSSRDSRWGDTDEGREIFPGMYHILGRTYRVYVDYRGSFQRYEVFDNAISGLRPQMIAANITWNNFDTANNTGGLASATGNIRLNGNTGSSFTNASLILYREYYSYNGRRVYDCDFLGDAACADTHPAADDRVYIGDESYSQWVTNTTTEPGSINSGLRAGGTIQINNVAHIDNSGSVYPVTTSVGTPEGLDNCGSTCTTPGGSSSSGSVGSAGAVNLGGVDGAGLGLSLTLPTNPNGIFVISKNPDSGYLIQSNPLFGLDASYLGSEYLATKLGIPTDTLQRRLGDAAYENYLVRQQLIAQTGLNILAGLKSEAEQMQKLLDNAAWAAGEMKLSFGVALTQEQANALKQDIVWMVEQEVAGQKVLVPVVYLSNATRAGITPGAQLVADNIAIQGAETFTNTGGTVQAGNNLSIETSGDITNTSGTISGGNVSLTSTGGNIVNQTFVSGSGDDKNYATTLGKTGTISSTGTLALDAKGNIVNLGADMAAGGDASLTAGGNIVFDTVQNKNTTTTTTAGGNGMTSNSYSSTTTSTVQQVGSGLTVGGNLNAKAGNDITIAGSTVNVTGNAGLDAGNNVNIIARENTTTTHSESHEEGLGRNGALWSSTDTTTDSESVRNAGSSFNVGGDASLKAKNDITFQGSDVNVAGSGEIDAGNNVNVLAGRNYDKSETTKKDTGVFQVTGSNQADGDATKAGTRKSTSSEKSASASASNVDGHAHAQASAGASGSANAQASGGLAIYGSTTTNTSTEDLTHVGSNLNFGKNVKVKAGNDVNLQGSTIAAGGDADIAAKNVNLLAAEDKHTSSTTSSTMNIGFMASTDNTVSGGASAGASAFAGKGLPNAKANAGVEGAASTENRVALFEKTDKSTTTTDITHQGSAIKAGGNMSIKAEKTLNVEGSSLEAGNDITLQARDMTFKAVQDSSVTTSSSSATSVGLYGSGEAKGSANAGANVGLGAVAGASAGGEAKVGAGLYGTNTSGTATEGSTTAVTSSIKSGGKLTRKAENNITDVGTQIDVGDLEQSSATYTSQAAANTTWSSSDTTTHEAKLGAFASAEAKAGVSAAAGPTGVHANTVTSAGAGAGVEASYNYENEKNSASSSTAVVSNINVRNKASITTTGATSLEGTNITSGGDTVLNVGSLDYKAAKNTATSTDTTTKGGGGVSVDIVNKTGSLSGSGGYETATESSSTAVVGGIKSGGALIVNSKGDARFEGTQLEAQGPAAVAAGGNLTFDVAHDTSSASGMNAGGSLDISAGKKEGSAAVEASYGRSSSSSDHAVVAGIKSGSGAVVLASGGDTKLVGTQVSAQEGIVVAAGGNLSIEAARDKDTSSSMNVDVAVSGGKGEVKSNGKKSMQSGGGGSLSGGFRETESDQAKVATLNAGSGNLALYSGGNTTLEGSKLQGNNPTVVAGGQVIQKEAVSTSSDKGFQGSVSASGYSDKPIGKKGGTGGSTTGGGNSGSSTTGNKSGTGSTTST
ncbi:MAG: hemagglutinin repeat-containing protein, partial [Pedobacter sp.]|nr:hemagglutinin repeat-containing protein [Pedobacter sp.]